MSSTAQAYWEILKPLLSFMAFVTSILQFFNSSLHQRAASCCTENQGDDVTDRLKDRLYCLVHNFTCFKWWIIRVICVSETTSLSPYKDTKKIRDYQIFCKEIWGNQITLPYLAIRQGYLTGGQIPCEVHHREPGTAWLPIELISKYTGLTVEEIEVL